LHAGEAITGVLHAGEAILVKKQKQNIVRPPGVWHFEEAIIIITLELTINQKVVE